MKGEGRFDKLGPKRLIAEIACRLAVRAVNLQYAVEDCVDGFRAVMETTELDPDVERVVNTTVEECLALLGADE